MNVKGVVSVLEGYGGRIRELREGKKLTRLDLSVLSGIEESTIAKTEKELAKTNPRTYTIWLIVQSLGSSLEHVCRGEGKRKDAFNCLGLATPRGTVHMGARTKELRLKQGYNRKAFADIVSIPYYSLCNLELDNKMPILNSTFKISRSLGVTMDFLVTGEMAR